MGSPSSENKWLFTREDSIPYLCNTLRISLPNQILRPILHDVLENILKNDCNWYKETASKKNWIDQLSTILVMYDILKLGSVELDFNNLPHKEIFVVLQILSSNDLLSSIVKISFPQTNTRMNFEGRLNHTCEIDHLHLLKKCSNLERVDIFSGSIFLLPLMRNLPLKYLHIEDFNITANQIPLYLFGIRRPDEPAEFELSKSLEQLRISKRKVPLSICNILLKNLPNISLLDLNLDMNSTEDVADIGPNIFPYLDNLMIIAKDLELYENNFEFPLVKKLKLVFFGESDVKNIVKIPSMPLLEEIQLIWCPNYPRFDRYNCMKILDRDETFFSNVNMLTLIFFNINGKALQKLSTFQNLKRLRLIHCSFEKCDPVSTMCRFPRLEEITLTYWPNIKVLEALVTCSKVSVIILSKYRSCSTPWSRDGVETLKPLISILENNPNSTSLRYLLICADEYDFPQIEIQRLNELIHVIVMQKELQDKFGVSV